MSETTSRELTTRDAAKLAGVTDSYIRYLLIRGVLRGRKLNNWIWLIPRTEIERWIAQRKDRQ